MWALQAIAFTTNFFGGKPSHMTTIDFINLLGEGHKPIGLIPFGDAPQGATQEPRYTTFEKLKTAAKTGNLVRKK